METLWLPSLSKLAIQALRSGKTQSYDRAKKKNDGKYHDLFDRLQKEQIRYFYSEDDNHMVAYFRSMKEPGKIMKGYWWKHNSELEPVSDHQYSNFEDFLRDRPEEGVIVNVVR